jgi:hypothetical protein
MNVADNKNTQQKVVSGVKERNKATSEEVVASQGPTNNYCTVCFVALGPSNPRQLCRKTYCENADFVFDFSDDS